MEKESKTRSSQRFKIVNKHFKEMIEEPELFIKNLRDEAPYPLLVINPDLSIGYVNPAFSELTGFTLEELLGRKPPYPWWIGDTEARTRDLVNVVLVGENKIERCNIKKNGERFWVQISGKPVYISGKLKYFLSNWVDITERKESEKKLNLLNQELRQLTAHLDSIREEERGNMSRMIHDEIGQALTALKMDICWVKKGLYPDQKPLSDVIDSMVRFIDTTIHKARWISTVFRPIWLDELGLVETIRFLVEEFREMTGIKCRLKLERDLNLDKQISTAIYRIFQEVLTNIFRHARATEVDISLTRTDQTINLKIADNGIGISKSKILSHRSFGIIGIRERTQFLGGTFNITGQKNKGTIVEISLPVVTQKE